jgi:hypothetical protein
MPRDGPPITQRTSGLGSHVFAMLRQLCASALGAIGVVSLSCPCGQTAASFHGNSGHPGKYRFKQGAPRTGPVVCPRIRAPRSRRSRTGRPRRRPSRGAEALNKRSGPIRQIGEGALHPAILAKALAQQHGEGRAALISAREQNHNRELGRTLIRYALRLSNYLRSLVIRNGDASVPYGERYAAEPSAPLVCRHLCCGRGDRARRGSCDGR